MYAQYIYTYTYIHIHVNLLHVHCVCVWGGGGGGVLMGVATQALSAECPPPPSTEIFFNSSGRILHRDHAYPMPYLLLDTINLPE